MGDDRKTTGERPLAAFLADLEARTRPVGELFAMANAAADDVSQPLHTEPAVQPPRRVSVAMGLAVMTTPHLGAVLSMEAWDGSTSVQDPLPEASPEPLLVQLHTVEQALGIPFWELEELQDEIDQRASRVLKQERVASWLWAEFGMPDRAGARSLAQTLFPDLGANMDVVRRGAHLYVVADEPTYVPEASLYLPWLAPQPALAPTGFRAAAIDEALRHRLARGIGATQEELARLLEGMVALVPRDDAVRFLTLDRWRHRGLGTLTDLGAHYPQPGWLAQPIPDEGASWDGWLRRAEDGTLELRVPAAQVFDALALPRVSDMVHTLYGLLVALVFAARGEVALRRAHLDLFDVARHLRAVLNPLVAWAGRSTTHETLAQRLDVPVAEVAATLTEVQRQWREQAARSWLEGPTSRSPSIQVVVVRHLLATHRSLQQLCTRLDAAPALADAMLAFTAHYLREGRLERLWVAQWSDMTEGDVRLSPVEDIAGRWFLPTWERLRLAHEEGE